MTVLEQEILSMQQLLVAWHLVLDWQKVLILDVRLLERKWASEGLLD